MSIFPYFSDIRKTASSKFVAFREGDLQKQLLYILEQLEASCEKGLFKSQRFQFRTVAHISLKKNTTQVQTHCFLSGTLFKYRFIRKKKKKQNQLEETKLELKKV